MKTFTFQRIETYVYRALGVAFLIALIANVYKHGWHVSSAALGTLLTLVTFALGIANDRPELVWSRWNTRYLVAFLIFGTLFLRILKQVVFGG